MSSGMARVGCVWKILCEEHIQLCADDQRITSFSWIATSIGVNEISQSRRRTVEDVYVQSGNSVIGLPRFLKRRMMSARLAAVQKLFPGGDCGISAHR